MYNIIENLHFMINNSILPLTYVKINCKENSKTLKCLKTD